MYSHSKTLFKLNDGTKMKFAVLRSSVDAEIVSSLIQWGGGSVSITDVPVAGAINLSCKKLPTIDEDIFNTSFVHASCLSNTLLDITGFCLGRGQLEKSSSTIPKENTKTDLDSESLIVPSSVNESTRDMLITWLNNISHGTDPFVENKDGNTRMEEGDSATDLSSASTCTPVYDLGLQAAEDSEIWPEDSASAVRFNIDVASCVTPDDLMVTGNDTLLAEDRIASQVNKWLGTVSSDEEEI